MPLPIRCRPFQRIQVVATGLMVVIMLCIQTAEEVRRGNAFKPDWMLVPLCGLAPRDKALCR